MVEEMGV